MNSIDALSLLVVLVVVVLLGMFVWGWLFFPQRVDKRLASIESLLSEIRDQHKHPPRSPMPPAVAPVQPPAPRAPKP